MYLLCSDWSNICLDEEKEKEEENCHLLITALVPKGAVIKSTPVKGHKIVAIWKFLKIFFMQNVSRGGKNQEYTSKENEESTDILNNFFDVDPDGFTEDETKKKNLSEKCVNYPTKLECYKGNSAKVQKISKEWISIFRSDRINT